MLPGLLLLSLERELLHSESHWSHDTVALVTVPQVTTTITLLYRTLLVTINHMTWLPLATLLLHAITKSTLLAIFFLKRDFSQTERLHSRRPYRHPTSDKH